MNRFHCTKNKPFISSIGPKSDMYLLHIWFMICVFAHLGLSNSCRYNYTDFDLSPKSLDNNKFILKFNNFNWFAFRTIGEWQTCKTRR